MGTDCAQGPEESHVRQRHLAWSISRQAHTYMRSYEFQVETANKAHLQLIVGSHQKFAKGRNKRQLAAGGEPSPRMTAYFAQQCDTRKSAPAAPHRAKKVSEYVELRTSASRATTCG